MSAGALAALSIIFVAVAVAVALRRGRRRHRDAIAAVVAHSGAARCQAAIPLFRALAARGDQQAIAAAWEVLELPLLQALPDCPPDDKPDLVVALDACAQRCSNRDLSKRIMTLRRGIYP